MRDFMLETDRGRTEHKFYNGTHTRFWVDEDKGTQKRKSPNIDIQKSKDAFYQKIEGNNG